MRLKRRGTIGLASVIGLVATLLAAPQAAFAAGYFGSEVNFAASSSGMPDNDDYVPYIATTGAAAMFANRGDDFYVYDTVADGHSAAAIWTDVDSARSGSCVSQWGYLKYGWCNKDFTEGHTILMAAAVYEGGALVRQSNWFQFIVI